MKKILMTLVLLVGIAAGLFAQKLTYQAVIRDNNQQLVVNTAVKATVTIDFAGDQADYTTTITDVSTNLHGLLSIEFGAESLVGRNWTDANIAVKVVNSATPSIVYVNDEPRPVSAVPYALSVDGVAIQQYLTEHKYVTEMQVGNQIHDSISNVAGKFHTHDNMAILNATEATYTKADSLKLKGIADSAEVNVQSDWKQIDGSKDDYIKNKPSITDTVNNILTTGKYVTETTLDGRHYLTSDSAVIIAMQGNIATNKADITTNTADIAALAGRMNTFNTNVCDSVKNCDFSGNTSIQNMLQQLEDRIAALSHKVDSLAALIPGGDTTEVPDGQPCPGAPTVSDGTNTYNTVKIGKQCWMAQNLRTEVGDGVYPKKNDGQDDLTPEEQVIYGRLYSWTTMMNGKASSDSVPSGVQGICPTGWHVPSNAEWTVLTDYVKSKDEYKCGGSADNIANALSADGWTGASNCNAGSDQPTRNKTGFSAVPAGHCFHGYFNGFGDSASFWSATIFYNVAKCRTLGSNGSFVNEQPPCHKDNGFSVRCLKDDGGSSATLPTVITASVTNITHNSATSGGDVTADGGANVTARGVCWSTNPNPTIADSHTTDGSGTGSFSSSITGLSPNTTYYVRAYATNSKCTAYGEEVSFTTAQVYPPTVTTDSVTNITHSSSTSGGDVTTDGGANVTARGVCWSTNQNPTIADSHTADSSGTGSFSSSITGLSAGTTYYVRAYATNSKGTAYGEEVSFTTNLAGQPCPGAPTVSDGTNTYNTVKIGNQCWMAQNLRTDVGNGVYPKKNDGRDDLTPDEQVSYGRLYTWTAMMNGKTSSDTVPSGVQGICPTGWHVPSDAEWDTLTYYVYNSAYPDYKCSGCESSVWEQSTKCIAKALSSTTGWSENGTACNVGNDQSSNNATGFSAVPAGHCSSGSFYGFEYDAYFWSATQCNDGYTWCRYLSSSASRVLRSIDLKDNGYSVRCLKDN